MLRSHKKETSIFQLAQNTEKKNDDVMGKKSSRQMLAHQPKWQLVMEVDSLFKVSLFGINFQQISSSVRRCVFFLIHTDSRIELDWCWYHNDFVNVFTMYEWIWQKKTNFFNVFNGQVKYAWLDANLLRICGQSFHSVRNASDSFVSYSCYCTAIKLPMVRTHCRQGHWKVCISPQQIASILPPNCAS